jgi:phospholipid/cholesterol/gamma-HCH transport system substrate-binding protein
VASERSLEVRVGALIIASLGLLGAFVLVLGGVSLGDTYEISADFRNPGAVQPGAPVKVSGYRVGRISELRFLGGELDPRTGRRVQVRMTLAIDREHAHAIRKNAEVFVTSAGVLGEPYLEIEPGDYAQPQLPEGAVLEGIGPPRVDLFLARAYELLDTLTIALRDNRAVIEELFQKTLAIVRVLADVLGENRESLAETVRNVQRLSEEAVVLVESTRAKVDGPEVRRILTNVDHITTVVSRDVDEISTGVRRTIDEANGALSTLGPEQRRQIQEAIADARSLADRADQTMQDAQGIVARIRRGEGTVGALVADEEVYDDLKELLRELKRNPWRLFWRE